MNGLLAVLKNVKNRGELSRHCRGSTVFLLVCFRPSVQLFPLGCSATAVFSRIKLALSIQALNHQMMSTDRQALKKSKLRSNDLAVGIGDAVFASAQASGHIQSDKGTVQYYAKTTAIQ